MTFLISRFSFYVCLCVSWWCYVCCIFVWCLHISVHVPLHTHFEVSVEFQVSSFIILNIIALSTISHCIGSSPLIQAVQQDLYICPTPSPKCKTSSESCPPFKIGAEDSSSVSQVCRASTLICWTICSGLVLIFQLQELYYFILMNTNF